MKTVTDRFIRVISHNSPDPADAQPADAQPADAQPTESANKSEVWGFFTNLTSTLGDVATSIWGKNSVPTPVSDNSGGGGYDDDAGGGNAIIYAGIGVLLLVVILVLLVKK